MDIVKLSVRQPVTIAVGVILILMAGILAFSRLPIQMTPNVEDTIIAVSTSWEGASPLEIEQEIIDRQEEKLQGLANLQNMTSTSQQGKGSIRLEFAVGTLKEEALRQVSDKLREVPDYPENAKEPVIRASDPNSQDFIAWIALGTSDPKIDIRTLGDFAEDRVKPMLERVDGISEVNVLGGREREIQVRFDPVQMAARGITPAELTTALNLRNRNLSAGQIASGKLDIRLRSIGQFDSLESILSTVIRFENGTPIRVEDVATAHDTFKEALTFVRAMGKPVIIMNAQKEVGTNLMEVMAGLKAAIADQNKRGGLLENGARQLGLEGKLTLTQVYDQTTYVEDALALVQDNIWLGGGLAVFVLVLFLRSIRSVGIITLAIPISVVGAVVAMVAMGRSVNVISLAGMAFAVGMVVDNAIVVLENIFRHLEMGKPRARAAYEGAREVWGAVLASTLTTIVVFIPILMIEQEAGQLFRDIALAICAAVGISMVVAVTVIPSASARLLKEMVPAKAVQSDLPKKAMSRIVWILLVPWWCVSGPFRFLGNFPNLLSRTIYWLCGSYMARLCIVALLTAVSLYGSYKLMPPSSYLPAGNRNLVLSMLITPPGYSLGQQEQLADRIEVTVRPFLEAGSFKKGTAESDAAIANLPAMPTFDWSRMAPGKPVVPPALQSYFLVSFGGTLFQGGVSQDAKRVIDLVPLFQHAARPDVVPGVPGFAFQMPLFRLGGRTGSAVNIDFRGDDLAEVTAVATSLQRELQQRYGAMSIQAEPQNFNLSGPEMQVIPDIDRLARVNMTATDLGLAVQAGGDGLVIGEYRENGQAIDLKLISKDSINPDLAALSHTPIATPVGQVVPLSSLATIKRTGSPPQINHVDRSRSVTLQLTPPRDLPLEKAIQEVQELIRSRREDGTIPPSIQTSFAGSASKLQAVTRALFGDGSLAGTLGSSLVMALIVVYLLMCVLFQSFIHPFVIMFSVPLATLGGFAALQGVFIWSLMDPYMPVQMLDVLTMLGFVILIGVVVNNAILIVHQSLNFMSGVEGEEPMPPRSAIAESVRTRVRPIFMSTLTSLGGMLPLVLMPGSGSELYRGLGSVVVGGLLVSTIFTLVLVPLLFSLMCDLTRLKACVETPELAFEPTTAGAS